MVELRRITYEETPASVIEFVAKKEAVHPLQSLDDLRNRLGPGRRVLALFHPMVLADPLVFVHAALTQEVPAAMTEVMALEPSSKPKCAAFYSITNAQPALVGIGLGESLIKQSIGLLREEFTSLDTFVTLSPMPRFRKWVEEKVQQNMDNGVFADESLLSNEDWASLASAGLVSAAGEWKELALALEQVTSDFLEQADTPAGITEDLEVIHKILCKLAARYILLEKHRGKPLDGVARFHLSNGALLHRINFAADLSRKGVQNSFGIMVNYKYDLDQVEANQRAFETDYTLKADNEVLRLLTNSISDATRSKL